jgi:hypothetical protein
MTTAAAHLRPSARSAFVPPVRPEPTVRGSGPPDSLAAITPTGIEPDRYATPMSTRSSSSVRPSMAAAGV